MRIQLKCGTDGRRHAVVASTLNGIDYLEVIPPASANRSPLLLLCFFKPFSGLDENNVLIEGGVRKKNIRVEWARRTDDVTDDMLVEQEKEIIDNIKSGSKAQHFLIIRPSSDGDFSTYVLKLVKDNGQNDRVSPPDGFDIILSGIDFSFKVACDREFDCRQEKVCPPNSWQEPIIDYMAKDFASFRLLMLDRLSSIIPEWKERNPADIGIMLIELLAYVGDHLSYYQDAVATESYLGTARSRISARRIARLLDYYVNDGCNARTLVYFEVVGVVDLPPKTRLLTGGPDDPLLIQNEEEFQKAVNEGAKVFETMHDAKLYSDHNEIQFYTWGDNRCCLPRGATRATLKDDTLGGLRIERGDVVVFEEVRSPEGGEHDEDLAHRQAVRLTEVERSTDPLNGSKVVNIAWGPDDALAFPLCLWDVYDPADVRSKPVSVARGNVIFAEHGYSVEEDPARSAEFRYRPKLSQRPLTFKTAFDQTASVQRILSYDARGAKPAVIIKEHAAHDTIFEWGPVRDLLSSDRFRREFVVEMENDGTAQIRFGDNKHGMDPTSNIDGIQPSMSASYSIGNGVEGNVGRNAIRRIVAGAGFDATSIRRLYNPIPAQGGSDPERLDEIRQNVPEAFMTQQRAVIESDYVDVLKRHPDIQKAAASFRWTGSWLTVYVTVDRYGGKAVDDRFKTEIKNFLNQYRLAGYDVEVNGPQYVPLEIEMRVCIDESHFREDVKKALLEAFANYDLASGERGFFHPDNFTFGQPLLISRIYERAMKVDGIVSVKITKLQRLGAQNEEGAVDEVSPKQGFLKIGFTETIRLDNDPNYPENGIIRVFVEGGR